MTKTFLPSNHVAMLCEGAVAMFGRENGVASSWRMKLIPQSACTALPIDLPCLQRTPLKRAHVAYHEVLVLSSVKVFHLFSIELVQTIGDPGTILEHAEAAHRGVTCFSTHC